MSGTGGPDGDGGPRLRILVVNWQDRENPQSGGAETHLHETFGRIAARGHEVVLLCSGWKGAAPRARLDGMEVHRVGRRYTFSLHARRHFRRHLRDRGFDVIVEDLNKVPLFTPFWGDTPVVLLVHHLFGVTAFQEAGPLLAAATWLLEQPVPRVFGEVPTVAVSESTAEDLAERGLPRDHVTVIPNGIEVESYAPDPAVGRFDEPTLLYLGRVKKYKRVDLVLEALAELGRRGVDARLVVGGRGDHLEALEALAARLGVAERVTFEGFVSESRKLELFRRAWVHVLTSPKEGWGISNLEAAACGTPSVASDSPGLRESVLDGETGFLVPHGDAGALADALERLLGDPGLRERMGTRGRRFAQGFGWDASADRLLEVLRRAADPHVLGRVAAGPGRV